MQFFLVKTIFQKELREVLRDRRMIMLMFVVPILIYPLVMIGFLQITALQISKLEQKQSRIVFIGRESSRELASVLDTLSKIRLNTSDNWENELKKGELDAVLVIPEKFRDSILAGKNPEAKVYYNSSRDPSIEARNRMQDILASYRKEVVSNRLIAISADTSLLSPFEVKAENIASEEQKQGSFLGRMLGYMLIIMTLMGAFYPSIDMTAGEKERGTLETLLVSPASRIDIVFGKFLAVTVFSLIAALLNVTSMGATVIYGVNIVGKSASEALPHLAINPASLGLAILLIIPLAVMFSAICLSVAINARNYKEGQTLLTPLYMLVILPAMFSFLPGTEMTPQIAAVPIVNISLLIKEYMTGNYHLQETLIAFLSTTFLALATLSWAVNQFRQESVLFRHAEEVRWSPFRKTFRSKFFDYPSEGSALFLVLIEIILLFGFSAYFQNMSTERTIIGSQLLVILLPPLYAIYRGGYDYKKVLALTPAKPNAFLATFILMVGAWIVTVNLGALQNNFFPFPEEMLKKFTKLFEELNSLPASKAILYIAILPGICEELLCRGFLLRSFMPRFGKTGGIVITAVAFGVLHLDPYRLLSTAFLGLILGYISVSTNSIFPSMFGHALNNTFSFLVQRYSSWIEQIGWLDIKENEALPWYITLMGVGLLILGMMWIKKFEANSVKLSTGNASSIAA